MNFQIDLYRRIVGEGPPILILHGLFGMSDNWNSVAKLLSDDFTIHLIDMRNHGRSPSTDDFSYDLMADDIVRYMAQNNLDRSLILGHSMGGKVALKVASLYPDLLAGLVIVDIGIKEYRPSHLQYLKAMNSVNFEIHDSRKKTDAHLTQFIEDQNLRWFLMKNIRRNEEKNFEWRINLNSLTKHYEEILKSIKFSRMFEKPTLFLRGSESNHIQDADWNAMRNFFKIAQLITVENAGHWIHADQPDQFLSILKNWIKETPQLEF